MDIHQSHTNGYCRLALQGQVDASSSIKLEKAIHEVFQSGTYKLLFDCKDLEYISSAGLGVFISFLEEFREVNGDFAFYNMRKSVLDTFQILGLHQILHIHASEGEAIASLDA